MKRLMVVVGELRIAMIVEVRVMIVEGMLIQVATEATGAPSQIAGAGAGGHRGAVVAARGRLLQAAVQAMMAVAAPRRAPVADVAGLHQSRPRLLQMDSPKSA